MSKIQIEVCCGSVDDTVLEGIETIKKLIDHAGDGIEILPGGGLRPHNIRAFVEQTKVKQVHLSAFGQRHDTSVQYRPHVTFGCTIRPSEDRYEIIDQNIVRTIRELLNR